MPGERSLAKLPKHHRPNHQSTRVTTVRSLYRLTDGPYVALLGLVLGRASPVYPRPWPVTTCRPLSPPTRLPCVRRLSQPVAACLPPTPIEYLPARLQCPERAIACLHQPELPEARQIPNCTEASQTAIPSRTMPNTEWTETNGTRRNRAERHRRSAASAPNRVKPSDEVDEPNRPEPHAEPSRLGLSRMLNTERSSAQGTPNIEPHSYHTGPNQAKYRAEQTRTKLTTEPKLTQRNAEPYRSALKPTEHKREPNLNQTRTGTEQHVLG